ncbi:MAG: metalloregulator ArsR/SmtB family transcription factor [Nocardioides sp.]|uniref:ArsR/SmtB family transcription factor n=1 Tax=Nocardioides sp. TaxID=35761 RepID=UPI0039E51544
MSTSNDLATLGRLLAVPSRAAMLDALFDGGDWAVGDLARAAGISSSTASEHLAAMTAGGLVTSTQQGRHRLYHLASDEIAQALESLSTLAPLRVESGLTKISKMEALHRARTCYDHLAGRLGVLVADGFVSSGHLEPAERGFAMTPQGHRAFESEGIDVAEVVRARRPTTLACLDWSEKRPHLAGALGAAVLTQLLAIAGIQRIGTGRAVRLRPPGADVLGRLGVDVTSWR